MCRFAREINNLQLKGLITFVTLCLCGRDIGSTAAALAHCHSVILASPRAAPGITTQPSGADICLSIDHKGLALDQTDCDRKLLFSPQKRPIACVRVIEWNCDAAPAWWAGGHGHSQGRQRCRRLLHRWQGWYKAQSTTMLARLLIFLTYAAAALNKKNLSKF